MQGKSRKVSGSRLLPQSSKAIPKAMHAASKTTTKCNFNAVSDCREPVLFAICFFTNARKSYPPILFLPSTFLRYSVFLPTRQSHHCGGGTPLLCLMSETAGAGECHIWQSTLKVGPHSWNSWNSPGFVFLASVEHSGSLSTCNAIHQNKKKTDQVNTHKK